MPVMEATSGDVPESSRPMNNVPSNPGEQEPEDKKPTSKYYDGQAEWIKPNEDEDGAPQSMADATNENRPSDLKYTQHGQKEQQADMPIEDSTTDAAENAMAAEMGTEGTANLRLLKNDRQHCPSCTCDAHGESISPWMKFWINISIMLLTILILLVKVEIAEIKAVLEIKVRTMEKVLKIS